MIPLPFPNWQQGGGETSGGFGQPTYVGHSKRARLSRLQMD